MPQETAEPRLTGDEAYNQLCTAITAFLTESRGRYTVLEKRMADLENSVEQRFSALETKLSDAVEALQARADDICRDTSYVRVIAAKTFAQANPGKRQHQAPLPGPDAPRPIAIDRACAVDPARGEQRVDLGEYGLTIYVTPGSDPAAVWRVVLDSLHAE